MTEGSCSVVLGQRLARCGSFVRGIHKKGVTGKAGVPRTVSAKAGRPRGGTAHILGCALPTNFMLRAGLSLEGGQLGSEDDTRSAVTALSRDKVCKQHVQHSEANPCAM